MMNDSLDHIEQKPTISSEISQQDQKQKDLLTVASGGSLSFIGNIANRGIKYLYSVALIWGLGAEDFGLFTLALTITTFVGVIANLGMHQSIIRYGAIYHHSDGRIGIHRTTMAAMYIVLPSSLLLMLILFWFSETIAVTIFAKPELKALIIALGFSIPFMAVQLCFVAATTVLRTMKYMVAVWTFQPLSGLLIAIPLMALDMGVVAIGISLSISQVLATGLALFFYLKTIYCRDKKSVKVSILNLFKFSVPLTFTEWIQFANDRTEIIFLGFLPNTIDVGIYKMADSLSGLESTMQESLGRILAPFSSELSHRKKIKELEGLYKTTAKWSFTLALALFLIFLLFAESIMNIFDPAFVTGTSVLIVLGVARLIYAGAGPCNTILIMSGRSDLSFLNTIIIFVINISLDWILIPIYGLSGAALAGAFTIILLIFLRILEVWITLHIHPFKLSFAKPIIAGLISFSLVYLMRGIFYSGSLFIMFIYALIFAAVYCALLYLLNLDPEDMLILNAIRQKMALPLGNLKHNT